MCQIDLCRHVLVFKVNMATLSLKPFWKSHTGGGKAYPLCPILSFYSRFMRPKYETSFKSISFIDTLLLQFTMHSTDLVQYSLNHNCINRHL